MGIAMEDSLYNDEDNDSLALREFLLDIDCLKSLDECADRFNIFDVLGMARAEIRHSNVLSWLLDPNENHGLGDAVMRGFLNYIAAVSDDEDASELLLLDCSNFTVRREWRNIDILAVSGDGQFVICIENKIGARERDDQLNRYRRIVELQYSAYYHVPFATPDFDMDDEVPEEEVFEQLDRQLGELMEFEARIAPLVIGDAAI